MNPTKGYEYTGDPNIIMIPTEAIIPEAQVLEAPVTIKEEIVPEAPLIAEAPVITRDPVITDYERVRFEINANQLKNILLLNNITVDSTIKMIFNKTDLLLKIVDPAHVKLIETTVNLNLFTYYNVETTDGTGTVNLGVNIEKLLTILKTSKKEDSFIFLYDSRADKKTFMVKTGLFNHKVNICSTDGIADPKIPYLDFKAKFVISTDKFISFLNQASTVSDHFMIQTTDNNIPLKASGDINNVEDLTNISSLTSHNMHKSTFSIDYVLSAAKSLKKLFKLIDIEISDDHPVRLTGYDLMGSGDGYLKVMVLIAPRIEEA